MNSTLIRERLHTDTTPFVLRLSDGTQVPVPHPDSAAVSPGRIVVINPKTEGVFRVDPLQVVAIEEPGSRRTKSNGKRNR